VKAEAGEGCRGLASELPGQVSAPPRKPKNLGEGAITEQYGWRPAKRRQSSRWIAAGHADAELRQWRPLQRWTGRRQDYAETHCAIAGLVSDRAAADPHAAALEFGRSAFRHACLVCGWDAGLAASAEGRPPPIR
jgi:hypothetical protein